MELVINRDHGYGFRVPDEFVEKFGKSQVERFDSDLVNWLRDKGGSYTDGDQYLVIADIPDDCTDCYIFDYDGKDILFYVYDGMIYNYEDDIVLIK